MFVVWQVVKQQQMDENVRLRATLEEWSHRNARHAFTYQVFRTLISLLFHKWRFAVGSQQV